MKPKQRCLAGCQEVLVMFSRMAQWRQSRESLAAEGYRGGEGKAGDDTRLSQALAMRGRREISGHRIEEEIIYRMRNLLDLSCSQQARREMLQMKKRSNDDGGRTHSGRNGGQSTREGIIFESERRGKGSCRYRGVKVRSQKGEAFLIHFFILRMTSVSFK